MSQESGGSVALRGTDVKGAEREINSFIPIGKALFKDNPGWMEGFTTLLSVAGQIAREKKNTPVAGLSPTAFLQEAKTASGRLINMTLGPLNSAGTKARALIGGFLEAGNSAVRAQKVLDRIYANPTYIIELAARFDKAPMDENLKKQLLLALTSGGTKEMAAVAGGDEKQQMSDLFPQ